MQSPLSPSLNATADDRVGSLASRKKHTFFQSSDSVGYGLYTELEILHMDSIKHGCCNLK